MRGDRLVWRLMQSSLYRQQSEQGHALTVSAPTIVRQLRAGRVDPSVTPRRWRNCDVHGRPSVAHAPPGSAPCRGTSRLEAMLLSQCERSPW